MRARACVCVYVCVCVCVYVCMCVCGGGGLLLFLFVCNDSKGCSDEVCFCPIDLPTPNPILRNPEQDGGGDGDADDDFVKTIKNGERDNVEGDQWKRTVTDVAPSSEAKQTHEDQETH